MADDLNLTITLSAKEAAAAAFQKVGGEASKLASNLEQAGTKGEHAASGLEHAGAGAEKGGEGAEAAEGKFGKLKESLGEVGKVAAGMVAGGVLQSLTGGLEEQFADVIGGATNFGAEVYDMGTKMGTSAEESSTLVAALQEMKIPVDQGTQAFAHFEKGLTEFPTALNGVASSVPTSVAGLKAIGVEADGADGKVRPFSDILGDVADKFKGMADGPAKTAAAIQLFGKSGADLIPMLNLGKDGIAEISEEAKKYGLQLSGSNVDSIRQFALAHNQMDMAIEGARLQIGTALIPVLNALIGGLTQVIAAVVPAVEQFLKVNDVAGKAGTIFQALQPYLTALAGIAKDQLVPALQLAWQGVQGLGEAVSAASKFINDHKGVQMVLVGILGAATAAWALSTAAALAHAAATTAVTLATNVMTAAQAALNAVIYANPVGLLIIALAGLVAGAIYAYNHFTTFRNIVDGALADVKGAFEALSTAATAVFGGIKTIVQEVNDKFAFVIPAILTLLTGPVGIVAAFAILYKTNETFRDHVQAVLSAVGGFFQTLGGTVTGIIDAINGKIQAAMAAIDGLRDAAGAIGNVVGGAASAVAGHIPGRAIGGPVGAGSPYIVGENGPELFVPGASGTIIPNGAIGGGGRAVVNNFYLQGSYLGNDTQMLRQLAFLLKPELDRVNANVLSN